MKVRFALACLLIPATAALAADPFPGVKVTKGPRTTFDVTRFAAPAETTDRKDIVILLQQKYQAKLATKDPLKQAALQE